MFDIIFVVGDSLRGDLDVRHEDEDFVWLYRRNVEYRNWIRLMLSFAGCLIGQLEREADAKVRDGARCCLLATEWRESHQPLCRIVYHIMSEHNETGGL